MVDRNGLTPVNKVYAPYPAFEVGDVWLTRGQATLEVIVQDIAGNERSAAVRFTVE
jgi:outer membrane usher protein FimD/PapC